MFKKLCALTLLVTLSSSWAAQHNPRATEWARSFYVDTTMDQDYLNGIASFISYMMKQRPSERCFNKEIKKVRKNFQGAPHYFQQSLVRLFSNCITQTHKMEQQSATPHDTLWRTSLLQYYQEVYPLLDDNHKTINYGRKKGSPLPTLH